MQDIETYQLRYFIETVRAKSMTRAARELCVSQQALSKGIRSLEDAIGGELFKRSPSGVELTAFGRFFLKRAKLTLGAVDLAANSLRDFEGGARRTVMLGITAECLVDHGGSISLAKLQPLQEMYPQTTFGIIEATVDDLAAGITDGSLQFAIGAGKPAVSCESRVLDSFSLSVIVSKDNPLSQRPAITVRDLATGRLMLPYGDQLLMDYYTHLGAAEGVAMSFSPNRVTALDPSSNILDPDTFIVLPTQHARRTVKSDHFEVLPFVDAAGEVITVGLNLIWRKTLTIGESERALMNFVTEMYESRPRD